MSLKTVLMQYITRQHARCYTKGAHEWYGMATLKSITSGQQSATDSTKRHYLRHHVGVDAVEVGIHKRPPVLGHLLTLLQ